MSIESVMLSNHLILCHPLLLLPSVFPSIRVFSNEMALHIRRPKYWNFNFSIRPFSEQSGLISFRIDCFDLLAVQRLSRVFSSTTIQKYQFFSAQPSLWSSQTDTYIPSFLDFLSHLRHHKAWSRVLFVIKQVLVCYLFFSPLVIYFMHSIKLGQTDSIKLSDRQSQSPNSSYPSFTLPLFILSFVHPWYP